MYKMVRIMVQALDNVIIGNIDANTRKNIDKLILKENEEQIGMFIKEYQRVKKNEFAIKR